MWVRKSGGETTVIVIVIELSSLQKGTKHIVISVYLSVSQLVRHRNG